MKSFIRQFCVVLLAIAFGCRATFADADVTVTPDWNSPGTNMSPEFCGLSFELGMVPSRGGSYFFRADHAELISLFKSLGVKNLRVGGNSADAPTTNVSPADIDSLFAFAKAADVQVIYNLRLKGLTDPSGDVQTVHYIMSHYKSQVTSFTIGNEPTVAGYFKDYASYREQWKKFAAAILAVEPDAEFNGPSATPGKTAWSHDFAGDIAPLGHLRMVTQHSYPGGNAQKVADAAAARALLLDPKIDEGYEKFYQAFVPAALENHEPYRLEEANSLFHGGATGVSNAYASALWALDYMHWWAAHGAEGINFHTGNHVVSDETTVPGGYDISYSTPSGLKTHPSAYALKAFSLSNSGRCIPLKIETPAGLNLTAYGVAAPDKTFILTIINREHGDKAAAANLTVNAGSAYSHGEMVLLQSPGNDISNLSGTTLGGAPIAGDGTWKGTWTPLSAPISGGQFTLQLPPATAVVIRLEIN